MERKIVFKITEAGREDTGNYCGYERIEVLAFNVDGKGTMIVLFDDDKEPCFENWEEMAKLCWDSKTPCYEMVVESKLQS